MKRLRWMLVALTMGGGALAANKEVECKKGCDEMNQECIQTCKERLKKKSPQVVQYCAPKCTEIKVSCEKDCEDEAKHKTKH